VKYALQSNHQESERHRGPGARRRKRGGNGCLLVVQLAIWNPSKKGDSSQIRVEEGIEEPSSSDI